VGEAVKILADVPLSGLAAGPHVLRMTLTADGRSAARDVAFTVR
jgi:hypothetical protein